MRGLLVWCWILLVTIETRTAHALGTLQKTKDTTMKETYLPFTADMVNALLDGRNLSMYGKASTAKASLTIACGLLSSK